MTQQGISEGVENLKVEETKAPTHEQNVTPWEVEGAVVDGVQQAIDYNKLINQFGTRPIDEELLQRFEKLTGRKPHILLRRGTFFSHRSVLCYLIDRYQFGLNFCFKQRVEPYPWSIWAKEAILLVHWSWPLERLHASGTHDSIHFLPVNITHQHRVWI